MPILKDFRFTKTVTLPSFPDSRVEIYDSLLVGDMMSSDIKASDDQVSQGIKVLPKFIKSWNFTNEAGEPLPIDTANIGFLKEEDVAFLITEITAFAKENKKKETT